MYAHTHTHTHSLSLSLSHTHTHQACAKNVLNAVASKPLTKVYNTVKKPFLPVMASLGRTNGVANVPFVNKFVARKVSLSLSLFLSFSFSLSLFLSLFLSLSFSLSLFLSLSLARERARARALSLSRALSLALSPPSLALSLPLPNLLPFRLIRPPLRAPQHETRNNTDNAPSFMVGTSYPNILTKP